jgi:hypothetical protein
MQNLTLNPRKLPLRLEFCLLLPDCGPRRLPKPAAFIRINSQIGHAREKITKLAAGHVYRKTLQVDCIYEILIW